MKIFLAALSLCCGSVQSTSGRNVRGGGGGGRSLGTGSSNSGMGGMGMMMMMKKKTPAPTSSSTTTTAPSVTCKPYETTSGYTTLCPENQPLFENDVVRAMDPDFTYQGGTHITVQICKNDAYSCGIVDNDGNDLTTPIYGYADATDGVCSWPGKTFDTYAGVKLNVTWENVIPIEDYLLTDADNNSFVDTTYHWAYSLDGYENYTIEENGVPTVTHLHGGHSDSEFDGNPEYFFTPMYVFLTILWLCVCVCVFVHFSRKSLIYIPSLLPTVLSQGTRFKVPSSLPERTCTTRIRQKRRQ